VLVQLVTELELEQFIGTRFYFLKNQMWNCISGFYLGGELELEPRILKKKSLFKGSD
jgi:hypothetical protein